MEIPITKLKAILRYFCSKTDPKFLGKVKLMKLFYFLDFWHVKRYGTPVTFDTYVHLEHGPIPSQILNLVNGVVDSEDDAILSDTIYIEKPEGTKMQRVRSIEVFSKKDESLLSERELKLLAEVCEKFGREPTKVVEDASHNEAPWNLTSETEEIPYSLAAKDPDCLFEEKDLELLKQIV